MPNELILGPIRVEHLTVDAALKQLDEALEKDSPKRVAFCNAHCVSQALFDPTYRAALSRMLLFNDGVALDIASRLITGKPFPANLNGTDFIPAFLAKSKHSLRIALLGGKPGVAHRAAKSLAARYPRHQVVFVRNGYFSAEQEREIVALIAKEAPDVLLVAMGNPLQELFMHRNAQALNCKLVFGVGALLDFLSESMPRAPFWMRKARLEWLFRLKNEPRRLMARYTVGAVTFAWAVLVFRIKATLDSP
ncbi:WecB/TagA/CpsF family glycosyltransferase [Methylocystis sp. Sn-Cys]|uniref:WecB/TagA/CpsF family glycosyltransferase n=1 Tax=Methylocystis sp. Sn-Cys TaxID=1701263 RepID=UPI001923A333|nr:WecB/TagA/CpsF family glycosyltransferase [Methylocystis sp. Sn-Cys]MBL1258226.1 WecB/TagA/CpsF family glycosyltransferase [Methylocystis sp. Sn-Cys]